MREFLRELFGRPEELIAALVVEAAPEMDVTAQAAARLATIQLLLTACEAAANAAPGTTTAEILDRIITQIKGAYDANHACVHFVHTDAIHKETVSCGMNSCPVAQGNPETFAHLAGIERAAMAQAISQGGSLRIADVRHELLGDLADTASFEDGLIIPIAYQGEVFAWVNVFVPEKGTFDSIDHGLIRAIGGMLYGALKKDVYIGAIERIRSTLEKHFSPQVVNRLISNPESLASHRSERLDVTILFSDLRRFTAFSESVDEDRLAEMVSEHLELMAQVVFRYGGIVDKYIGDSVMAVFGSPFPQDNHAQRAVAAAMAMIEAHRALQERWGTSAEHPLAIGIGINTGTAIAGEVGVSRREFTHLGDAVNLASRLKDAAQPWQVLINQSTHERVSDMISAEAIEPLTVKGKSEPIAAFAVSAYIGDRSALDDSSQPAVTTSVVTAAVALEPVTSTEQSTARVD